MLFSLASHCCCCLSVSMKSFILGTYVLYMRRIVQRLQNQAELGAPVAPRRNPKIGSKQQERKNREVCLDQLPLSSRRFACCHDRLMRALLRGYASQYVFFFTNSFSQIKQIHKSNFDLFHYNELLPSYNKLV